MPPTPYLDRRPARNNGDTSRSREHEAFMRRVQLDLRLAHRFAFARSAPNPIRLTLADLHFVMRFGRHTDHTPHDLKRRFI